MLHSFAGRRGASIRRIFRVRGKIGEAVGHSHHIPVTPDIELIHLFDVLIFEPAWRLNIRNLTVTPACFSALYMISDCLIGTMVSWSRA